jgi:hypothetical protein
MMVPGFGREGGTGWDGGVCACAAVANIAAAMQNVISRFIRMIGLRKLRSI